MADRYTNVCIYCGKSGGSNTVGTGGGPPMSNPSPIIGRCPSSPDGKHKPRWELK